MEIERNIYLDQLILRKNNGMIKVQKNGEQFYYPRAILIKPVQHR